MLWVPMELFLASSAALDQTLARERRVRLHFTDRNYGLAGALRPLSEFRVSRHRPLGYGAWQTFRSLVAEDKREATLCGVSS